MRHVKESSGKQPERGIGIDKAEAFAFSTSQAFARGERSGVSARNWKQIATATNEGPTMHSQERQQSDAQTSNTAKRERGDESSNSAATANSLRGRKQFLREAEARIPKSAHLRQRVLGESSRTLAEDAPPLGIEARKTNILIWCMFM